VRDVVYEDAETLDRAHAEEDEVPGLGEDDMISSFVSKPSALTMP